jgi:tetratricopeptide (TPR) repeat protein
VAFFLRDEPEEALRELEYALTLDVDHWGAYFWQGLIYASLEHVPEALSALERALALKIPAPLLAPLHWLRHNHTDFYETYATDFLYRA